MRGSYSPIIYADGGSKSIAPSDQWQAYTPSFTGFGTVTSINMFWMKQGPNMLIKGDFTLGTVTAVEAQVTLPNSHTVNNTILGTVGIIGGFITASAFDLALFALGNGGDAFFTHGRSNSAASSFVELDGNAVNSNDTKVSVDICVPITGW